MLLLCATSEADTESLGFFEGKRYAIKMNDQYKDANKFNVEYHVLSLFPVFFSLRQSCMVDRWPEQPWLAKASWLQFVQLERAWSLWKAGVISLIHFISQNALPFWLKW